MRFSAWVYLLHRDIRSQAGKFFVLILTLTLTCFLCGIALHLFFYSRMQLRPYIEGLFPENRIVVTPGEMDIAFFKLQGRKITSDHLRKIRDLPGVTAAYPQATLEFPSMADVSISSLDLAFETDIVVLGVPGELIEDDLPKNVDFTYDPSKGPVPVALSAYFLDMYNLGLAEGATLPKFSRSALIGRQFDLVLGESTFVLTDISSSKRVNARIVGLVTNPELMGLVAPLEAVQQWNSEVGKIKKPTFVKVHVDVGEASRIDEIREKIGEMGLRSELSVADLRQIRNILSWSEAAVLGFVLLVVCLSMVGIVAVISLSTHSRRPAWGLHRATGLSPVQLLSLVKIESLLIAIVSSTTGVLLLSVLMAALFAFFGESLGEIAMLPKGLFTLRMATLASIYVMAIMMVTVPAMILTLKAVRAEPVTLLRERNI